MQSLLTFETAQVRVYWLLAASRSEWVRRGKKRCLPGTNYLEKAKIYLLRIATRSKHFLMQIEAEKRKRSSSKTEDLALMAIAQSHMYWA